MKRNILQGVMMPFGAAVVGLMACAGVARAGVDDCFYKGTMFSDGAMSCQTGAQFRCKGGDWKATGSGCTEETGTRVSRNCDMAGISYSTGAASCQNGTQFRCEDGAWRNLGVTCPVGDTPLRAVPSGRTCMYEGATVSSASTICKGGTTFLCEDGSWTNLGTQCR
jgi:hypothetical protein